MSTDELRARRAGRREANLRELNERIADARHDSGRGNRTTLRIVCECARGDCEDALDVPVSVFSQARASLHRFIVAPGHVLCDVEQTVARGDGWLVVEKLGTAARAAATELA